MTVGFTYQPAAARVPTSPRDGALGVTAGAIRPPDASDDALALDAGARASAPCAVEVASAAEVWGPSSALPPRPASRGAPERTPAAAQRASGSGLLRAHTPERGGGAASASPSPVPGQSYAATQASGHGGRLVGQTFGSPAAAGMLNLLEGPPPGSMCRPPASASASARRTVSDHKRLAADPARCSAPEFSTRGGASRQLQRPRTVGTGARVRSEGATSARSPSHGAGFDMELVSSGGTGMSVAVAAVSRQVGRGGKASGPAPQHTRRHSAAPARQARPPPAHTGLTRPLLPSHDACL